ncbi:MAG: mechanosensitive ion channel, partial [Acidobacteriaceae bacterium]|nr:mechanosensitive ion channel [Acidobacteriaceae bacterium]
LKPVFRSFAFALITALYAITAGGQTPSKPAQTDTLGRTSPRSAVTAFLEACHGENYVKAAQYLDLSHISPRQRAQQAPQLAKDLQDLLNSDTRFNPLNLSQDPQGNLRDDPDPDLEHVATVTSNGREFTLDLRRVQQPNGPAIWLWDSATVARIPALVPVPSTESRIVARLPRFFVSVQLIDTPLWKWLALLIVAVTLTLVLELIFRFLRSSLQTLETRVNMPGRWAWLQAVLKPALVLLAVIVFRIAEEVIGPSALARERIGGVLLLVSVSALAWGLINLLDVFLARVDALLDPRQRVVSHSLIYLGRRVAHIVIVAVAALLVLSNWGYNVTTVIAGLGVGGIAVALAAQQTIANVFGGISVIGDNPVMIGDFGNFGGLIGTIEDIGMRSTRVRTLNRSVVSVPNASFAGMNLENYSVRDKMLFNPTLQVKRTTPKDQIRRCMNAIRDMLARNKAVETGPAPVRIGALASASFALEIFVYVLTSDLDEFYKIQADLLFALDDVIVSSGVELV